MYKGLKVNFLKEAKLAMGHAAGDVYIDAAPEVVWAVVSRLEGAEQYTPSIQRSFVLGDQAQGIGACRQCDLKGGYLREKITQWKEGQIVTFDIYEAKGVPIKRSTAEFRLTAQGKGTNLRLTMSYEMKGGLVGPLLEFVASGLMRKANRDVLLGIKTVIEHRPHSHIAAE